MNKIHSIQPVRALCFALILGIILSGCTSNETSPTETNMLLVETMDLPVAIVTDQPVTEPDLLTREQALDIAVAHVLQKTDLEAPGEWTRQDITPHNLVGSADYLFTSGAWVARITNPVVAPEFILYTITLDHVSSGMSWTGEVMADGTLNETSFIEPLSVLSVEAARDMAAAYIVETYSWSEPTEWLAQPAKPGENAGVIYTFTSGPWVIQVENKAAAPIVPDYYIIADNLSVVARWTGTVTTDGEVLEKEYITN
jgi:hypothetical protein